MKIDEIVKKHKESLNVEQAPPAVWGEIRDEWKKETNKKVRTFNAWKIAATILLTTTFGLIFYTWSLHQEVNHLATLGDISNEYKKIENQYQSEIKRLETTISLHQISSSENHQWLLNELKTIDNVNRMYRADIGKVAYEEQLVRVLMDYYEKKIKLLKKLELEIQREAKNQREEERNIKS